MRVLYRGITVRARLAHGRPLDRQKGCEKREATYQPTGGLWRVGLYNTHTARHEFTEGDHRSSADTGESVEAHGFLEGG